MLVQSCCMVMRLNLDCNSCCRKARQVIVQIKGVETHMIDKEQCMVTVCGRFRASDVAIKLHKKMKRRVKILEIQEFGGGGEGGGGGGGYQPDNQYSIGPPPPTFFANANGE
ncbi:hypothetical protein LINPERHAP1_LOCUS31620 [Linum perenne]